MREAIVALICKAKAVYTREKQSVEMTCVIVALSCKAKALNTLGKHQVEMR